MIDTNEPPLQASALTRHFGPTRAVDELQLTLQTGEILGLLGPNGAGKTTALRMLTGALAPDSGRIRVCGHDLRTRPIAAKRRLGYLPERPPLYPELTVNEYLRFCARLHRIPRRQRAQAVAAAMHDCGLDDVGGRLLANLSKGYQQRAGIAQAIVHCPDVVILDEPTAGLDPHQIRHIRALITRLAAQHSVILSSHILPEIQATASRVMLMHQGRVALDADMAQLAQQSAGHIRLRLAHAPAQAELEAIDGVTSATALDDGDWRITAASADNPAEALAAAAVYNGWGLRQLVHEQRTLEELFVELTTRDHAVAA